MKVEVDTGSDDDSVAAVDAGAPRGLPAVVVTDDQNDRPLDVTYWADLARGVLIEEGLPGNAELNLTFVDEVEMADLNARYMGSAGSTDVLSFPIDGELFASGGSLDQSEGQPLLLGDVVVCPTVAERNAPDHAGTFDDEIALLVVHGVLHLLGHDHIEEDERVFMQGRERELLTKLHRLPHRWPWD